MHGFETTVPYFARPSRQAPSEKRGGFDLHSPTQFAPNEDLGAPTYPRTWKADMANLIAVGMGLVWNPDAPTVHPQDFAAYLKERFSAEKSQQSSL